MEIVKNILVGMTIILPILFAGYGLFVWIGPNGIIIVMFGLCVLWLCGAVGMVLRSRGKATS